jgi:hypothetical protein
MLKGQLTISCTQSNAQPDYVSIRIEDNLSRVEFVQVEVSMETFALALMGKGYQECAFTLRRPDLVGMIAETKTELLPCPMKYCNEAGADEEIEQLFAPFEVSGWVGERGDIRNGHRKEGDKMRVAFSRHVNAAGEPVVPERTGG